jgi:hypothetical protein
MSGSMQWGEYTMGKACMQELEVGWACVISSLCSACLRSASLFPWIETPSSDAPDSTKTVQWGKGGVCGSRAKGDTVRE